jgi:hypothetical protein
MFQVGANLAAFEIAPDGEPCVVFMRPVEGDLEELLTMPGEVLEKLRPPDGQPVSISRDGRGMVLSVPELVELQGKYKVAIGLLEAYRSWLAGAVKKGPVIIWSACYLPAAREA